MGLQILSIRPEEFNKTLTIVDDITLNMFEHNNIIITIGHVSDVSTIVLPEIIKSAGMRVTVVLGVTVTSDFNIDCQTVQGMVQYNMNADNTHNETIRDQKRFLVYDESLGTGLGVQNGIIGDYVDLYCNGQKWIATSYSQTGCWVGDADGTI